MWLWVYFVIGILAKRDLVICLCSSCATAHNKRLSWCAHTTHILLVLKCAVCRSTFESKQICAEVWNRNSSILYQMQMAWYDRMCVRERQRHNVAIAINPLLELCCLSSSRTKAIHLWNLLWILFMLLDVLFISIPYGIVWCLKHRFNSNSRYTSQLTLTFWRIVRWFAHVLTFVLPFRWSIWFQSFKSDCWAKLLWFEYFRVWCWDFRGKF